MVNVKQYITDDEGRKIAAIIDIDELNRLKKLLQIIPQSESWLYKNMNALESVQNGLKDALEGKISKLNIGYFGITVPPKSKLLLSQ